MIWKKAQGLSFTMEESSRTELDSHANMPVVGRNAFIISDTGRMADVKPYSPDYESMAIPIVDAAVRYDCPYDAQTYILVIRNALHVPSMQTNLIPPFIMREAGITVHDTPKMQMDDPTNQDHSIYFPETRFRIPMSLWGIFSYFPTSKPSAQDMVGSEEVVYMLTPTRWNPHEDSYANNGRSMLDWEGNIICKQDHQQILLSEIQEDDIMAASVSIGSIEVRAVDVAMEQGAEDHNGTPHPKYQPVPGAADQISGILGEISPMLNDQTLYQKMKDRADLGKFQASIGSTNATSSDYLVEDDDTQATESSTDDDTSTGSEELLDELYAGSLRGEIDLDEIMISAAHAGRTTGLTAANLAKTWRINLETAERTIDITSQHSERKDNPTLSRNYGTNDRML